MNAMRLERTSAARKRKASRIRWLVRWHQKAQNPEASFDAPGIAGRSVG